MIDRVAQALYDNYPDRTDAGWKILAWDNMPAKFKDSWRLLARAAVEAMLTPERPMIVAGSTAINQRKFGCPPDDELDAVRVYRRMIDAALSEPRKP